LKGQHILEVAKIISVADGGHIDWNSMEVNPRSV
jgi:hypothetical protein